MNRKDRRAALKTAIKDGGFEAAWRLAMACINADDPAGAERAFRAALRLRPDFAEGHANLGAVLEAQGREVDAVSAFAEAVRLKPDYPEAHYNLGAGLLALGRGAEAIAPLQRAVVLRPNFAVAHCNLGDALAAAGRLADALAAYDQAIALSPSLPQAHNNRGVALGKLGRRDEALAAHRRAIGLNPAYADAHLNLGTLLLDRADPAAAMAACARAVELAPGHSVAHNALGLVWRELGQVDKAEAAFRRAISLSPEFGKAWANLADILALDGRFADAVEAGQRAVALIPDAAFAQATFGVVLEGAGDSAAALAAYERAVALDPGDARAQINRATALLRRGRYAEGWAGFEWRWRLIEFREAGVKDAPAVPRWQGEDLNGRTILLTAEQGYGDTLQFVRFAAAVAARGGRVVVRAGRPLLRLLQGVPGVAEVTAEDAPAPQADVQAPLMSLPHALGLTDVPAQAPYIKVPPTRSGGDIRSIGIVWAGAAHSALFVPVDRRRSLTPEHLAPLLTVPGIRWVSLQKDAPVPPGVEDGVAGVQDFAETAAVIAGLDLVISVDTSVAHLAAAMGKPVWLLSRFDGCWRWLENRDDSPWYPTLKLFRQDKPGDWEPVLARVADALRGLK